MFLKELDDWKEKFAKSMKKKALKKTFNNKKKKTLGSDGKKNDRDIKGYRLKGFKEVEFYYNIFKHYFHKKVNKEGRIACHGFIRETCPLCHIKLFGFCSSFIRIFRTRNQSRCVLSKEGCFEGKTMNNMRMTSNRLLLAGNESKKGAIKYS